MKTCEAGRSSYALIGQKSGSALSEVLLPEGSGTAVAVAQVVLPEPVPLLCKMYNCFWGALRYVLRADALETPGNSLEACCEAVGPGNHAVIVRSAGFSDGNEAEFWVNGELIYKTGTRGLTIVDLWPDMTVKHTETFDTYTDACLQHGDTNVFPKLNAVHMKSERLCAPSAQLAMVRVEQYLYRYWSEPWMKPLPASAKRHGLAEHPDAVGVLHVRPTFFESAGPHYPSRFHFGPFVALMLGLGICRDGQGILGYEEGKNLDVELQQSSYALIGIKGGNALSEVVREEGAGYAVAVAEATMLWSYEALGMRNGELIYETSRRGLTVVDLWPDMTVKHTETFDTHIDSSSLVAYLSSVDEGSMILVGAADEASASISFEAANLLRESGATFPRPISWRSSYALIGIKGGEALSEVVRAQGDGYAVAVAEVSPPETTPPPPLPFCDMKVAEPPMSGVLAADGNLELDAGCRFRVWESPDMAQCLSGTWVVVTGSSNALLIFNTLLMLLAPAEADVQRRGRYGGAHLLDAVVEDGVLIYYETVRSSEASCIQSTAGGGSNETECRSIYSSSLQNAPPPNGRRIRVTMFLSFFWARTGTAMDLVEADRSWATAEVAMVVQVVAWYVVCNGIKFTGCPRSNLIDMEEAAVKAMFVTEMEAVLDRMAPFCEPGGRAGQRGCAVATNSWSDPGPTLMAMFQGYNSEVTKAMQPRKSSTFRLVDIFALGATMPGETYLGHGSQILHIWTWQALLGGFCAASSATPGRQMEFEGPVCWRKDASLDSCTAYTGTVLWQCMNSMLCVHRLLDKPTTSQITTTSSIDSFAPVDGGADRACRGAGAGDNSASYYNVISAASLLACKEECIRTEACVGIEYSASRCEVWTRPEGIQASVHLAGFTCLSYASPLATTTTTTRFAPVDGGADRACRGAGAGDNSASYYNVISAASLLACKEECIRTEACVGIEYSASRCEVWTRPEGIQASVHLAGFTCLSYASPLATTTTTTRMSATLFEAVDGGINRACRGASASDNAPANYVAISGVRNLGDCQIECTQVAACVGIEFSNGRCEVWIRPGGIQASVALSGFTCQRLLGATRRLDMDMTVFP
ncbi:unnamed protein product [Symbiodinium natans]|uniref:ILEI/PANDER domain-containing protein n=1 Tax=Symbiodinium natans TaxID=878477 RepID=A0A812RLW7_9DINO|nr:unnamed protein product [Symbiodinium natans]